MPLLQYFLTKSLGGIVDPRTGHNRKMTADVGFVDQLLDQGGYEVRTLA